MKIYTKTGDKGQTRLVSGTKVSKSDVRLEAYGTIDELNAHIGMLHDLIEDDRQLKVLNGIRNLLFVVGANLADDAKSSKKLPVVLEEDVLNLEKNIDLMSEKVEPLKYFVLPGGHSTVSYCHIARTVCRRAERALVILSEQTAVDSQISIFINRLSDYLFALGRFTSKNLGVEEVYWKPKV